MSVKTYFIEVTLLHERDGYDDPKRRHSCEECACVEVVTKHDHDVELARLRKGLKVVQSVKERSRAVLKAMKRGKRIESWKEHE